MKDYDVTGCHSSVFPITRWSCCNHLWEMFSLLGADVLSRQRNGDHLHQFLIQKRHTLVESKQIPGEWEELQDSVLQPQGNLPPSCICAIAWVNQTQTAKVKLRLVLELS